MNKSGFSATGSAEFNHEDSLVKPDLVILDAQLGSTKKSILTALTELAAKSGRVSDSNAVVTAAVKREEKSSTGLPGGVAIPHCRSEAWSAPSIAFARINYVSDFDTPDGPADLIFFIGVPESDAAIHTDILKLLAKGLLKKTFVASLRGAETAAEAAEIINEQLHSTPRSRTRDKTELLTQPAHSTREDPAPLPPRLTHILAITACPTGIAHTYIAADALASAADQFTDLTLSIETQGARGTQAFSPEDIAQADAVISAADVPVSGLERFQNIPIIKVPIKRAINEPQSVIAQAQRAAADAQPKKEIPAQSGAHSAHGTASSWGTAQNLNSSTAGSSAASAALADAWQSCYAGLSTGVSHLVPFAAAAGLLASLSYLLSGNSLDGFLPLHTPVNALSPAFANLAPKMFAVSALAFDAMIPILAAFIALGIAGKAALAPGFIAGALASALELGFTGALVVGLFAGVIVALILKIPGPGWWDPLVPGIIVPLFATALIALIVLTILAEPLASLNTWLIDTLQNLNHGTAIVLAALFGMLMCIDLGGPINKIVYLFTVAALAQPTTVGLQLMAAVMAAGMVPPLAAALATSLSPRLFTDHEQAAGRAGWIKAALFITEGALPFVRTNRTATIAAFAAGGCATALVSMSYSAATLVPHGGVFVIFAVAHPGWWLVAIALGSLLSALLLALTRYNTQPGVQSS